MAGASLLTLLDDIATLLDDVAVLTKVAAKKICSIEIVRQVRLPLQEWWPTVSA